MGRFQIYPNLYVILLAPPGRFRKSTAIDVARDAIEQLDPRPNLAPSKVTPQAFYDVLHAIKKTHEAAGIVTPDSTAFAFIRELGTLLNRKAFEDGLAELLNEGFDCAKTVDYQTKGRGKETALNVCFGLLAGTTITGLRDIIPEGMLGQGLASRFIFVHESVPAEPVSRPQFSEVERRLYESLVRSLKRIMLFSGECHMTPEAWAFYDAEYNKWCKGDEGGKLFSDAATEGYASRKFIHMLKLGMLFATSQENIVDGHLVVEQRHLAASLDALRVCEKDLKLVVDLVSASPKGSEIEKVKRAIMRAKRISRSELMRYMSSRLSSKELSEVIDTLVHANIVEVDSTGGGVFYRMKE